MFSVMWVKMLGSVVMVIIGGVVATVTVFGLVNNIVDTGGAHPGNSTNPSIDYGSNG